MTYAEKLQHPNWQKKRLAVLKRDGFTCLQCGDTETTLHVHHTYYVHGREPWDYPIEALKTLCKTCHSENAPLTVNGWNFWEHVFCWVDIYRVCVEIDDARCRLKGSKEELTEKIVAALKTI